MIHRPSPISYTAQPHCFTLFLRCRVRKHRKKIPVRIRKHRKKIPVSVKKYRKKISVRVRKKILNTVMIRLGYSHLTIFSHAPKIVIILFYKMTRMV